MERLSGAGWSAQGVDLSVKLLPGGAAAFELHIARLRLKGLKRPAEEVSVRCVKGNVRPGYLSCPDARVRLFHPVFRKMGFHAGVAWDAGKRLFSLEITRLAFARGSLRGTLRTDPQGWRVKVRARGVDPVLARRRLKALLPGLPASPKVTGRMDLRLQVLGKGDVAQRIEWALETHKLAVRGQAAGIEGEGLHLLWKGEGHRARNASWRGRSHMRLDAGALLTPWFYLDPAVAPVTLETRFHGGGSLKRLHFDAIRYRHGDLLRFDAQADLDLRPFRVRGFRLISEDIPLRGLYENYLQPTLAESLLESVVLSGAVRLFLKQDEAGLSLSADVKNVSVKDAPPEGAPRFALRGLDGRMEWREDGRAPSSYLRWASARLLEKIAIGPALVHFHLDRKGFHVLRTAKIPVMDGELVVDRLRFDGGEGEHGRWQFEGVLTPISMERFSKALGWPPLAGKLSGVIPGIAYEDGTLKVEGTLLVRIFGGRVRIRNLVLDDLLGYLPTLRADIDFHDIDLETLTRTFSFGRITGRLEGYVKGLYLEDWRPVAFDARLETPPDDPNRHRISQKAIDNISNIGGAGVSGALSRSFLGIFKEFNYDRLGIKCHLRKGVCHMEGVAPAENGYYLVIGKGIPQINIKGFTRETDWNRLVDQLVEITHAGAPVVK